jgi:hypothetical protein
MTYDHTGTRVMKYTWGDTSYLNKYDENKKVISSTKVEIVGITQIKTIEQSEHFNVPVGSVFYTVEFEDGSDAFVKEEELGEMQQSY